MRVKINYDAPPVVPVDDADSSRPPFTPEAAISLFCGLVALGNDLAVISLVATRARADLFAYGVIATSLTGIACGAVGLFRSRRPWMALAGLLLSLAGLAVIVAMFLAAVSGFHGS